MHRKRFAGFGEMRDPGNVGAVANYGRHVRAERRGAGRLIGPRYTPRHFGLRGVILATFGGAYARPGIPEWRLIRNPRITDNDEERGVTTRLSRRQPRDASPRARKFFYLQYYIYKIPSLTYCM